MTPGAPSGRVGGVPGAPVFRPASRRAAVKLIHAMGTHAPDVIRDDATQPCTPGSVVSLLVGSGIRGAVTLGVSPAMRAMPV